MADYDFENLTFDPDGPGIDDIIALTSLTPLWTHSRRASRRS